MEAKKAAKHDLGVTFGLLVSLPFLFCGLWWLGGIAAGMECSRRWSAARAEIELLADDEDRLGASSVAAELRRRADAVVAYDFKRSAAPLFEQFESMRAIRSADTARSSAEYAEAMCGHENSYAAPFALALVLGVIAFRVWRVRSMR